MGWLNKLKAAKQEVTNATKRVSKEIAKELEETAGDKDWYKKTKEIGKYLNNFGRDSYKAGSEIGRELLDDFGKTQAGKNIGKSTRYVAGFASKVPLLSVSTDILRSRNGVDFLYKHLKLKPDDPERHLWLAEAMLRMERDQQRYVAVRAVLDPSYLVARQTFKTAAGMNNEKHEPTYLRLLKNSFSISFNKLKTNPNDAKVLHILGRIYLIQDHLGEATRLIKLAILADPTDGHPYVSLSRIYYQMLQYENVKKASRLAVIRGASIGNEVLAEVQLSDQSKNTRDRINVYNKLLENVTQESREIYWGPSVIGFSIIEEVGAEQLRKTKDLLNTVGKTTFWRKLK